LLLCNTVAFPPSFPPSNGFFGPSTFSSSGEDGPRKNCARIGKNPSLTSDSILFLSRTSGEREDIFFAEKKKGTSQLEITCAADFRMDDEKKKKKKDNTWREKETKTCYY
jgi:hypothetical protein